MIKVKGKEFRNLEEQVLYLSQMIERILDTNVLLAQFGIKVIDQVNNESDLLEKYPRTTFQGEYGDAVLVGAQRPYDYYIWTRPFDEEVYGDWLNIGQFPLPGPKGETGATGPTGSRGQRGNKWYTGQGIPSASITDMIEGDLYLNKNNGLVFRYLSVNAGWVTVMGIKGPRGENGSDGAQGPAGPVVDLVGVLTSVDQLPSDIAEFVTTYGRQGAYLIGPDDPNAAKYVWGLTGTDDNLQWTNLGLFATGTIVYVNGTPVETANLNNYVPKVVDTSTKYSLSAYNKDTSSYEAFPISDDDIGGTIPLRKIGGLLEVGTPIDPRDASNKNYVDTKISEMAAQIGSGAPERYYKNIVMSYREYIEDEEGARDETFVEAPQYIELKPGMEFDLVAAVDSQELNYLGLYVDLIGNQSSGSAFFTSYFGEAAGNPDSIHGGIIKYHVIVSKAPTRLANGTWADWLTPEITAYFRDGTVAVESPNISTSSGDVTTYAQANLRLKFYNYPTYYNSFFYYGNTEPNVQLSEIK